MNLTSLCWNPATTPANLHSLLGTIGEDYRLTQTGPGRALRFRLVEGEPGALRVRIGKNRVEIEYGAIAAAARGIAHALAGVEVDAQTTFTTMGIMLDCSRNAVMKVSWVKRWLRQLALLGYDTLMLYTEDTYQLPGEPFFGYMRGGYTSAEVKEIDAYAAALNIKVIACIQTMGHLEQILKWSHFRPVMDTPKVLLADEEKTYELIGKMIRFWSDALGSRRIHLGMDEADELGRGRFIDKNGYEPQFDIFNRHLSRVCRICEENGLQPMIWSDMVFRMGNPNHDYYDRNTVIPDEVKKKILKSVELVYWDYYSSDESFYTEWIDRHRALGYEPVMASGIWTWARFWYDHGMTTRAVVPCLNACRKAGVKEVLFTMWADGGGYCEFDSAFAGLAYAADLCYGGNGEPAPLLKAVCGSDYDALLIGSELQVTVEKEFPHVGVSTVLWDDPLLGIGWQGYRFAGEDFWPRVVAKLASARSRLEPHQDQTGTPDFNYLWSLCNVLIQKIEFREALVKAYQARDSASLLRLKDQEIPRLLESLARLETAFRRQWLRRNKPFGMEVVQIRLGAQSIRYRETATRIGELLDGTIYSLEEIDAKRDDIGQNVVAFFDWLATGSLIV